MLISFCVTNFQPCIVFCLGQSMQALEPNEPEDFCIPKNSDLKNF